MSRRIMILGGMPSAEDATAARNDLWSHRWQRRGDGRYGPWFVMGNLNSEPASRIVHISSAASVSVGRAYHKIWGAVKGNAPTATSWGRGGACGIVEETICKLAYRGSRSLPYNDLQQEQLDDILALSPTRWPLRKAMKVVNRVLGSLRLKQHPEKTFIGRMERGFDFLGYYFSRKGLTVARETLKRFVERAARLYEQEPGEPSGSSRRGVYVKRWLRWVWAGLWEKLVIERPAYC